MLLSFPLTLLYASAATASTLQGHYSGIQKRDGDVCTDLSVSSNNGDRKVAIVIDSSGSMATNDPYDLRIQAGRALNEFLIANGEATGNQKPDLVTVIDFDYVATLDYPLGDPGGANASFSKVDALGGTYIAAGVNMAIDELTGGGGPTEKRSAIVIFTDGEDVYTDELVDAINNATAAGIRVSFGFLDTTAAFQPPEVLTAVKNSRGVYATITVAAGSQNYINYVLLNGLTYNDNPQGYDTQLLAGLAETHFINGSDSVALKYAAQKGENVNFTITTISAGELDVVASINGKTLNTTQVTDLDGFVEVTAPSTGDLELKITANVATQDSMFSVITNSNVPLKNCTVGVTNTGSAGLSKGAKAGVGIGVTAALVGIMGLGGWFLYKHFYTGGGGGGGGGGASTTGGEGGIQYAPGAEKPMATTTVYPVDGGGQMMGPAGNMPMSPPAQAPMSLPAQGPMSLPAQGPMSLPAQGPMSLPAQAPMSAPPMGNGGLPPDLGSGGLPAATVTAPMAAAPSSGMATAGSASLGSQPFAFAPPMPPNMFNNKVPPKEKGDGVTGSEAPQAQYTMPSHPPGDYQQPMGPSGSQPLSPGSCDPGTGNGGCASAPGSQQPMGYGPDGQPMSTGSQAPMAYGPPDSQLPFGSGGESFGPGSQAPMGSGGHSMPDVGTLSPQHPAGPEGFQQNAPPGTYQDPTGTGTNPMLYDPNNGGVQQFHAPGNYQQPMSGYNGFQHTMGGQGQAPMGSNPGYDNGGISGQSPMGPDGFNHTMCPDGYQAPSSPPFESAPAISPNTTGGGDLYNPNTGGYDGQHPFGNGSATDWNNQPMSSDANHFMHDASNNPMSSHNHHTDYTNDYHDPDACSCSSVGSLSDHEPLDSTESNPGFTMPGAPFRSADKGKTKHKHKRR